MVASSETTYLAAINSLIEQRLRPVVENDEIARFAERDLNLACRHLCISDHSKRVRPLLCLYFHWLFEDCYRPDFVRIGVAAEFIHAASLLHDDIIDEAEQRRGRISANRHFGNAKAVLAGDFLLTEAFELLRDFDRELIDQAIVVVREMTKAAMMELNTRGRVDPTPQSLRQIAVGKTGTIFAFCGFAAAYYCKVPNKARTLWEIGERMGIIFQLADDIKDFDGDHSLKDICRDIRNRELSLPVLMACEENGALRNDFTQAFALEEITSEMAVDLKEKVLATRGVDKARAMMRAEIDFVMTSLAQFKQSQGQDCLARFVSNLCSAD